MTIKNGYVADAGELITSYGRIYTGIAYNGNISDGNYINYHKYTSGSGNTGTTALHNGSSAYVLNFTDEASGDATSDPDSFTNPGNAFDSNDTTYAEKSIGTTSSPTYTIGKTFTSKYVSFIKIKTTATGSDSNTTTVKLQKYDGSTWSDVLTLGTDTGVGTSVSYDSTYFINSTTQGVRIAFSYNGGNYQTFVSRLYTLEYGDYDSSSIVKQNSIFSISPDSMVIYADTTTPTNTSITVDISDDGGSTYDLTDVSLNEYIDTTILTGTDISIKFNLATTDTTVTPKLTGWSAVITDN